MDVMYCIVNPHPQLICVILRNRPVIFFECLRLKRHIKAGAGF